MVTPKPISRRSSFQLRPSWLSTLRVFVGMAGLIAPSAQIFANTYQATYNPGWNFMAVHLLNGTGNHLSDLLPSVPDGSAFARFNNATQTWSLTSIYKSSSGGWDYPNEALLPGEGAYLYLLGNAALNVTIVGTPVSSIVPVNIPANELWFVSRQTEAAPSSYDDIVGQAPTCCVSAYTWNGGFSPSSFDGDVWDSPVSIELGNSVWLSGSAGTPPCPPVVPTITFVTQPPPNVTVVCGQPLTLTASINFFPGVAQSYRWEKNGVLVGTDTPISQALYPLVSLTIPSPSTLDSGNYVLLVKGRDSCNNLVDVSSSASAVSVVSGGVNAAPTLGSIPNPAAIKEDAPMQTINLTGITPGPAGESWQTITITATSSNPALIPNPTVIYTSGGNSGTLTYTPVANQYGSAVITVTATDNGQTACVNDFKSKSVAFTVVVKSVNDVPSFNLKAAPTVTLPEDTLGVQTVVGQAINISKGPLNEGVQQVNFNMTYNNSWLFTPSGKPTIDPNGDLHFELAANQYGTSTVTAKIHDNGGLANGGVNTSAGQTFKIIVTPVNDAPTLTSFSAHLTGAFNGTPFKITYAALKALGDEADVDGNVIKFKVTAVQSGTLTKSDGITPVTPGVSQLGAGGFWWWTPSASGNSQTAFSVVANDGLLDSTPAVAVIVDVQ